MVRCKFVCNSVEKMTAWNSAGQKYVYNAKFSAVTGGSGEDGTFFAATPNGEIKIGTYREDVFEVGADYYFDATKAE